jgi:Cu(I)/Ag(I) efflux system membrane fusion protein
MNKILLRTAPFALGALIIAFTVGRCTAGDGHDHAAPAAAADTPGKTAVWTCSMHPQVRQPSPGLCPICAMALIPVTQDDDPAEEGELPRLRLSARSLALMDIRTAPVRRRPAYAELRLPGMVAIDETRITELTARFSGRIEQLHLNQTGVAVRVGEHLLEMYSPQLFAVQEEFLQALRATPPGARADDPATLAESAHAKLGLLGLTDRQIAAVAARGAPATTLTYYSPVAGTVIERKVAAGQYVDTGQSLFTVADLSRLWVVLEAFESELDWLRYGQQVDFAVTAYPGATFTGRIAYIEPAVDERRRTVRVRVHVANDDLRLKPGMLATGTVRAQVGAAGVVLAGDLAGKWISPMHPEIVRAEPGACDVCGMDLVPAESMGYFARGADGNGDPLVIPATAPLLTGRRAIVYVRLTDHEQPTFAARQVTLGARLGDVYLVRDGLAEGELVVVNGQFKIDSELQIRGRPSMLAPAAAAADAHVKAQHLPAAAASTHSPAATARGDWDAHDPAFAGAIAGLQDAYLRLTEALAADDPAAAGAALDALRAAFAGIGAHRLSGAAHLQWMHLHAALTRVTDAMRADPDIANYRRHLQVLSDHVEYLHRQFPEGSLPPVYRAYCPMVDGDQGGSWLQRGERIDNPYFGALMRRCGEIQEALR